MAAKKISDRLKENFPDWKKIPVVFYQTKDNNSLSVENINNIFSCVVKVTPLNTLDSIIDLFENYDYLNFIKLNDIEKFNNKGINELNDKDIINNLKTICSDSDIIDKEVCPFEVYTLKEEDYNKIYGKKPFNFFVLNSSGKLSIFDKSDRTIIEEKINEGGINSDKIIYKDEKFNTLEGFITFFVRNCKILFLSKKEDYQTAKTINGILYNSEVLYPKYKDLKKIDLFEDMKAILNYSLKAKEYNLYQHNSLWAEYFLQKEADGISVIDNQFNILYANEKRRQRHKNNILGKKCYKVFRNKEQTCDNCFFDDCFTNKDNYKLSERQLNIINDSEEIKVKDKAGNSYYLTEYNRIVNVNCYQTFLGISACKDTNVSCEIIEMTKEIQREEQNENHDEKQKIDFVLSTIKKKFIEDIHFENIRVYENFNNPDDNENPTLVLIDSTVSGYNKGDIIIDSKSMKDKGFYKTENLSALDFFNKTKENKRLVCFDKTYLKPDSRIFNKINHIVPDKWIGIPLWNGDQLIGSVCIDMGEKAEKWKLINHGINHQLQIGSEYLASTFKNLLTRIRLEKSRRLIEIISKLTSKKNIIEGLLEKITEEEAHTVAIWYEAYKNHSTGMPEKDFYRIKFIAYNGKNERFKSINIINSKELLNNGNKFCIINELKYEKDYIKTYLENKTDFDFSKISKVSIPIRLRDQYEYPRHVLQLITGVGKGDIPFTYHDFELYKDVIGNHFAEIYKSSYERSSILYIIQSITKKLKEGEDVDNLTSSLFSKVSQIYPETIWCLYLKNKNILELIYKSPNITLSPCEFIESYEIPEKGKDAVQLKKEGKYSLTVDLFHNDFGNTPYKYFKNYKDLINFVEDSIKSIQGTKHERGYEKAKNFSELNLHIKYKGEKVGILRVQELKNEAFDFDFMNFALIFAELTGNIIGLLEEIDAKKKYENSLAHALRSPINSVKWTMETIPRKLDIKSIDSYLNMNRKLTDNSTYWLYRLLYNVKTGINIANFYVENINSLNFNNYQFNNGIDIRKIVLGICFLKMDEARTNKKGLIINIKDLIETGRKTHLIKGDESKFKLAIFNIIDNAIKYSLKVKGEFKPIEIYEEYDEKNDFLIYRIRNYGEPPTDRPQDLVKYGFRGSNAKNYNIDGTGEGLARCKDIFEKHVGFIRIETNLHAMFTEVRFCINLSKNLLLKNKKK